MPDKRLKIQLISTFSPRECGIANYSDSVYRAILSADSKTDINVTAISDRNYSYPAVVNSVISQTDPKDYLRLAQKINESDIDIVSLQHEFNIFGGYNGKMVLGLLNTIKKPVVITLHTVPIYQEKPFKIIPKRYKSRTPLLKQILSKVSGVTVMTETAKNYLIEGLEIPSNKVFVVPHGAPYIDNDQIEEYRKNRSELGFHDNDFVISTFGLLSPTKGIEYIIKALPDIIANNPGTNIKYLILGRTHPNKPKTYLEYLQKISKDLGVVDNVLFDSRYLTNKEIYRYLVNTDIYITPYYRKEQASSGTLSYALACGCCIVSTPYVFAREIISKSHVGELVTFKDDASISRTINNLINQPKKIKQYAASSLIQGRKIMWPNIGQEFLKVFRQIAG